VGAQLLVELLVAAFAGQVQVELAQRRRERVRVVQRVARAVGVVDLELVAERQLRARDLALEQAGGVPAVELDPLVAVSTDDDALGRRPEGAHDHAAVGRVCPEEAVWVAQPQRQEGVDVLLDGGHWTGSSSRRAMPATGMCTQFGRLLSS
jgi:hypothetical protein